jgi:hypothetical protein
MNNSVIAIIVILILLLLVLFVQDKQTFITEPLTPTSLGPYCPSGQLPGGPCDAKARLGASW